LIVDITFVNDVFQKGPQETSNMQRKLQLQWDYESYVGKCPHWYCSFLLTSYINKLTRWSWEV